MNDKENAQNGTTGDNGEKEKQVTDPKTVLLHVDLDLIDNTGSVARVKQDISIPYIKEPAFVKGAYSQIENTLDVVCVSFFKKLVKNYCLKLLSTTFEQPAVGVSSGQRLGLTTSVGSTGYKEIIDTVPYNAPASTNADIAALNGEPSDGGVLNLEVEEEAGQEKSVKTEQTPGGDAPVEVS